MIMNNAQGGENLEIVATKSMSVFEWNKETVLTWVRQYAEKYVGLMVTEENLPDMEEANRELSRKINRMEEFRKTNKTQLEAPIKRFEADVKEVIAVIESVKKPIADQVRKFEDQRRCEQASLVSTWIDGICSGIGLRPEYAKQISVAESWTNRTAVKSKVKTEIEAKATALMAMQSAYDQAEEMKRQKNDMAEMMCKLQSEAAGLAVPIQPKDIYGLNNLSLTELPAAITAAVKKQQDAEQAAVIRARQQQEEAAAREAKRIADEAVTKAKEAERLAAAEAIRRLNEVQPEVKEPEPQFKMMIRYFGTKSECDWLVNMLEGNGIDILVEDMVQIS